MPLNAQLTAKREKLLELLRLYKTCAVALSGGVDSAVVAKAAHFALGERAIALTGKSASVSAAELEDAIAVAKAIGIRHQIIETSEFDQPAYRQNAPDRCYHCKTELYSQMEAAAAELGFAVMANGANTDDLGDYRPGMTAASEHAVRSPLVECGISKSEVRQLAADWNLPVFDKPASPCLSSRVAYGEEVTPERVAMIEAAEALLRSHGFREFRVRYHRGELARIEAPLAELERLVEPDLRDILTAEFRRLGFKFVTLDLQGFRSGSLNDVIATDSLRVLN